MLSLRSLRALTVVLTVIGAFVFFLAPSGAATSATIFSFTSSVTTLPPEGAPFSLSATVANGSTCTFTSAPALAGFPVSMPCASSVAGAARGIIVKTPGNGNPAGRAMKYVFSLVVTDSGGFSVTSFQHPSIIQGSYRWAASNRPLGLSAPPRAVSCGTPTFCMVVGAQGAVATFTDTVVSRRFTVAGRHTLTDVSCAGTACMLLNDRGNYFLWGGGKMSGENPFYENGSKVALTSVSCASPTFCMAVGDGGAAVSFDAGVVTDRTAAGHGWNNAPRRVSCASSHLCVVVTTVGDGFAWDGSTWTSLGLVDPGGDVTRLSCASGGTCAIADGSGPAVTIQVSGATFVPIPLVDPPVADRDMTCSTASYCLALDGSGHAAQGVANAWSPPFTVGNDPPVALSCSRGFKTPLGSLCVTVSGDGKVIHGGTIVSAVTPTCEAPPQVGPVQVTVTPADGAAGFVYAPGQFFEGDTVGLSASASPVCVAARPGMHYSWSIASRPAGSTAALSSPSSASPSFVPDVVGTYQLRVVATDSLGNPSPPAFKTVTTGSCGANVPTVSIGIVQGMPMDTVHLTANVSDPDNDAAACPARFAQTHSFAWSVVSRPGGGGGGGGGAGGFSDASAASPTFTPDVPGVYTLKVVTTGQKSGVSGSAQTTLDASCAAPTVSVSVTELNGAPYGGEDIQTGDNVKLGGGVTASCSANQQFTYAWSLSSRPAGSSAALSSSTDASPSFTPDVAGTYQFSVVATDAWGRASDPGTLDVSASSCGSAPVVGPVQVTVTPADSAFVSAPGQVFRDDTVTLSTTASSVCHAARTGMTYAWSITGQPAGSSATLNNPSAQTPSFVPDVVGTYQFSVVATDSVGRFSPPAFTTVTTESCGANAPAVSIQVGSGMPMDPRTVSADVTDLDNSASCPARFAQTYSYAWSVVSGPGGGGFSDASVSSPTFTPDLPGTYVLKVVATGQKSGLSDSAQTTIDTSCAAPAPTLSIAEINGVSYGGEQVLTGDDVKVAANVYSACTTSPQSFTYQWHLSQSPPGSSAALSSPTAASPSFTPDVAGSYEFSLVVTDGWGRQSAPQTFSFATATCSAAPQVGTVTPAAGAGGFVYAPGQFFTGDTVGLGADVSVSCRSGTPLAFSWSLSSRPAGSSATLSDPSSQNPSFVPDVAGAYQVSVQVRDSFGNTSAKQFSTLSTGSCGSNPPTVSIAVTPAMPMDPHSLVATPSSADDDIAQCPARFQQTYSYAWSVVSGPGGGGGGGFSDASVSSPTFTPDVPGGTYVLKVVATGQKSGLSGNAQTTIDSSCAAPAADPSITELNGVPYGGAQVLRGDVVTVGSTPTSACYTSPSFSYSWSLSQQPAGSSAALSSPTDAAPTFVPDVAGTYQVRLVVTDSTGRSSDPKTLDIVAAASCDNTGTGVSLTLLRATQHFDAVHVDASSLLVPMDINLVPNAPGFAQPSVAVDQYGVPIPNPPVGAATTVPTAFYLQTPITVVAEVTAPPNACALQFTGATLDTPAGSTATLTTPTSPQAVTNGSTLSFSFTPDMGGGSVPGNYAIQTQLDDGGASLSRPISAVDVGGACGASVPATPSFAFPDFSSTVSGSVGADVPTTLSGTDPANTDAAPLSFAGSTAAGCGLLNEDVSYHWSAVASNPADLVTLTGADTQTPVLTAAMPGDVITVNLVVDDGTEQSQIYSKDVTVVPSLTTAVSDADTNTLWSGSETTGASAYDTVTWASDTGTSIQPMSVVYFFFDDGSCSGNASLLNIVTLDALGFAPRSSTESNLSAGTHSFQAFDLADSANASACEPFTVSP